MSQLIPFPDARPAGGTRKKNRPTYFSRAELFRLLSLYSQRVATGEWKDYAIDHQAGRAIFSVFRSAYEAPQFAVVKCPANTRKGPFLVYMGPREVGRGQTLDEALSVFEKRLRVVQS